MRKKKKSAREKNRKYRKSEKQDCGKKGRGGK